MTGHATRAMVVAVAGLLVGGILSVVAVTPAGAGSNGPCGPPVTSVIACENSKPGDPPTDWKVSGSGDPTIQGFATQISVDVGQTVFFKVTAPVAYHIDILRLGWYAGLGARIVQGNVQPDSAAPQNVPPVCSSDAGTGLVDCGGWSVSAHWHVPAGAVSGLYAAHLVRNDTNGSSLVYFVVRNDASHSDIVFQTSDETWQAYNTYGGVNANGQSLAGNSLYTCVVACPAGNPQAYKSAYAVSYNRPLNGTDDSGRSDPLYVELNMIEFLEANGYDVSYLAGADVDTRGALLRNHKIFTSSGHDEYWSATQRANVEAARDAGVNLAFFSGNEVFWKTRFQPSITDGAPTRTLVTYKETHFDAAGTDPQDPNTWTGTWMDPRFSPPADGGRPENALTGQLFLVNSGTTDITVPAAYAGLRIWRNTAVAALSSGSVTIGAGLGTLGYEWDEDADNGFRPAGEFDLSSTTAAAEVFTDYGSNTDPGGTATHHLSLYRAPSGALVFGAGSVQFAWALMSANNPPTFDVNARQMVVNLLADMGNVQPASLLSGLVAAGASTDHSAPTSAVTSPAAAANETDGSVVTVSGTASDAGGGVVAGVEVSTDGGSTWHPATGTTSWTYSWNVHGSPTATIRSRAVDDSGNLEAPAAGVTVNVGCPCSVFGAQSPPANDVTTTDPASVEVGMKFTADVSGTVTGMRFYKSATNTGTHVGSIWTGDGSTQLATGTFSGESSSGWQTLTFGSPATITAGATYVVGYLAPNGHYSRSGSWFYPAPSAPGPDGSGSDVAAPLHPVLATGTNTNGMFLYTASSAFPSQPASGAAAGSNYWVDIAFTPTSSQTGPDAVGNVRAVAANASATVSWTAPSTGGSAITSYTVQPIVGASPAGAPITVSGTPPPTSVAVPGLTDGTAYRFAVRATDGQGTSPVATTSVVTPTGPPAAPSPVTASAGNGGATVSWSPPANGGATITSYTVTPHSPAGDLPPTIVQGTPPANTVQIAGLTNGTTYTFTVSAANGPGPSPDSAPSNQVTPTTPVVPAAQGTWLVASDGGIFALGAARFYGSTGNIALAKPIVGMAPTPDAGGYWLVASDGGIFAYGDARFYGSTGNIALAKPIVGMAATRDGGGYWLVASDGGIFAFGDARFYGSTGNLRLVQPVVGMATTADNAGYWLVAADGGLFAFGDAGFYGSAGNLRLAKPVVGMSPSPTGHGYRLVASDGGLFSYGDAPFYGALGHALASPVVGMANTASGQGYRMVQADGSIDNFGDATVFELPAHGPLARPVVGIANQG